MKERLYFHGALVLDPDAKVATAGGILVEDGRVEAILPAESPLPDTSKSIDLTGLQIAPGFLDLHYHGDLIFRTSDDYAAALAASSASLVRHGTTGFLPTSVTWGPSELLERVGVLAEIICTDRAAGASPLGLHLEGPWISAQAAGAQPAGSVRNPKGAEVAEVLARGEGAIRMVTYAPEIPGAAALQIELAKRDVVGALGHSLAAPAAVNGAVARGASHVTHLFNAMGPMHHRAPGLAGSALADERLTCDLICDGAHVHPTAVRMATRALDDRLVLITDRIEPTLPDGDSETGPAACPSFGSGPVVDDGIAIRFSNGSLAGSSLTLDLALRNLCEFADASLFEAVKACTLRPARVLGIESERGTFRRGARADFAILDAAGRIRETWIAGRRIYAA